MKEQVQKQTIKKPKGLLLTLMFIVFQLLLILIASTLILMIFKISERWIAAQSNFYESILSVIDLESLKVKLFLNSLPLMALIISIFLIDGLVQRDIRKFQFARESTYLFHRSKLYLSFCFYVPMFIYFVSPVLINAKLFFTAIGLVLGMITHFSTTHFKKYL